VPASLPLSRLRPRSRGLHRRQLGRDERGQGLFEFALVAPIFALVVFGIIEFGNLMRVQIELDEAVRTGAREAAILPSSTSFAATVQNTVTSTAPDLSAISFSPAPVYPAACPASTSEVTVTVSYPYAPITPMGTLVPLFGGTFPSPKILSSSSTVHSECN
jgi:Flp pilus assembly protein TadG